MSFKIQADFVDLLDQVKSIALKAGKAVMSAYSASDCNVECKEDLSPQTTADRDSHTIILGELDRLTPQWPVISEETASAPWKERAAWPVLWLVDPLDGTKEFLRRNGEFTVNIALVREGRPVLGVVYAPALGKLYCAAEGVGAFRSEDNHRIPIQVGCGTDSAIRIVGSRSHADSETRSFVRQFGECEFIPMGSSLKFCLVAEGAADLYPRLGPTMEWDTAAAHCVVIEAGGSVTDLRGNPLTYNKPDLHNPHFVARSNRFLRPNLAGN